MFIFNFFCCSAEQTRQSFGQKILEENWLNIKPVLAVSSGGLHPGLIPYVMKMLGNNIYFRVLIFELLSDIQIVADSLQLRFGKKKEKGLNPRNHYIM
jgi:hypothetical protein